ncbi:MAG: single-stranded-DNA-specific exonuclease RecJ [bacterium]|nr:single-stranded-DNA-specific exonuclease RecJ [bacterium]
MEIKVKNEITERIPIDKIVELILKDRGIEDREAFISPPSPETMSLSDFGFKKKDITQLINILSKVYESNGTIVVYTDYDADGITGGAVLWETLHLLGFNTMPYVPNRITEGYGFSIKGLDNIKKKYNPDLIISVDHGITATKQIRYAKEKLGIPIIVTDHHHKQETIPTDAKLIIHIPTLSGSGVAYFVAKEIYMKMCHPELNKGRVKNDGVSFLKMTKNIKKLEHNFNVDYAAIASIGTVADLVPLVGPSRSLVSHGLQAFSRMKRHGFTHLFREAGIEGRPISPYEVGFLIAPRINAIGRLEHAIDALRLICTTSNERAQELAHKMGSVNTKRQELVKEQVTEAEHMVESQKMNGDLPKLIILYSDHWHEGVIGLIASSMVEKYYRPTIVMTKGDGHYKASVRSISGFHITEFLGQLQNYLINYGGHAGAAGFTMLEKKRDIFIKKAQKFASDQISEKVLERTIVADIHMPISLVTRKLYDALQHLNPFGIGNPRPVFMSEVTVVHAGILGKLKNHLKLQVKDPINSSSPLEMVAFNMAHVFNQLRKNQTVRIVYQIDLNVWNGRETLQGLVKHIEL